MLLGSLVLVGVAPVSAQPTTPEGHFALRLVEVPEEQKGDPRAERYIVDRAAPGTTFSRKLAVINGTDHELVVDHYAVGASTRDGVYEVRDDIQEGLASWMTVSPASSVIPEGEFQVVEVTFDVPADAPPGEHLAVVLAEVASEPAEDTVQVVNRLGMRVYLSVGEGEAPASNFTASAMTPGRTDGATPYVDVLLRNSGGRTLDIVGEMELSDGPGGLGVGPVASDGTVTLRPGDSASARFRFAPELPAGPWTARAILRSGLVERVATAEITFPAEAGEAAEPVPTEIERQRRLLLPVALGLLLLLMALMYVAWRTQRTRNVPPVTAGREKR